MAIAPSRLRTRVQKDTRPPRARRRQKKVSYNEDTSSDEDNSIKGNEQQSERITRRRRNPRPSPPSSRTRNTRSRNVGDGKKLRIRSPKKSVNRTTISAAKRNSAEVRVASLSSERVGKKMPWQTLPFYILTNIFAHAASPMVNPSGDRTTAVGWLIRVATLCKAFTEPALSVLYYCPPVVEPSQLIRLESTLRRESDESMIKYRHKIKHFDIQHTRLWQDRSSSHKYRKIGDLVALTPSLRGIHLGPPMGNRAHWGRSGISVLKHSDSYLVSSVINAKVPLESWAWNFALEVACLSFPEIKKINSLEPFSNLKSLTISNISEHHCQEQRSLLKDSTPEAAFADAIRNMPSLQDLHFDSVSLDGSLFLPELPDKLKSLTMTDCPDIETSDVSRFLTHKGHDLRRLVLNHNSALSLSFLTILAQSCPYLETFAMDLVYYNPYLTFRDTDPKYDLLMLPGERPTWPSTLINIELLYLRRWETPVAEEFFSSLVDHAPSLPDLRYLKIKASLRESSWRNRVAFKSKWVSRLEDVFLRRRRSGSKQLFNASKRQLRIDSDPMDIDVVGQPPSSQTRHSQRIKSDSQTTHSSQRRRRRRQTNRDSSLSPEDSAFEEDLDPAAIKESRHINATAPLVGTSREAFFVQGMCDTVDIVIDNLRPMEDQVNEKDFLDDERSGDSDWNAEDDNIHVDY